jgi:hypothetical protein
MQKASVWICLAIAVLAMSVVPTSAQGVERSGFLIGFSLGGGSVMPDCDGCETKSGPALDIHVGGMLNEKLALMFDGTGITWSIDDPSGDATGNSTVSAVAVQYWPAPKFWVKGGAGFGSVGCSDKDICGDTESGLGLMVGAGVELIQKGKFTLDLQGRLATYSVDDEGESARINQFAITLGCNWY